MKFQRIFILGISGVGKTTLAKKISNLLSIPHFDLDEIYWIEKYSEKRSDSECIKELELILEKNNSWVIEGVYDWGKVAIKKSDLVIWLNYGINTVTYRILKRSFTRNRNKESWRDIYNLIKYVRSYKKVRANREFSTYEKYKKAISGNEHKLVEIRNNKELKVILEKIKTE